MGPGESLHAVETVILLLLVLVAAFAAMARRFKVPYPIVLVLAGLAISFVPRMPRVPLNPNIVFVIFLPPLLYASAWTMSWREFRRNAVVIGLLAVGTGWIAASLHVFLRDTAQMVSVVLTFWFWMTPIMIAEDKVPYRVLLTANPMYYAVRLYRQALFTSKLPDWGDVAKLALSGAVVFVAGGLFFRYMKRGFADVL